MEPLKIIFVNGVFNSFDQADLSRRALEMKLGEINFESMELSLNDGGVTLVHNESHFILDLFEAFLQKSFEIEQNFFRFMQNSKIWPDSWIKIYESLLQSALSAYRSSASPIQKLTFEINEVIVVSGGKALIVAHSQGNFFANDAIDETRNSLRIHYEIDQRKAQLVSVASPSHKVEGGGSYTTLLSDGIIKLVPSALAPNVLNTRPKPGLFDHEFLEHYLEGDVSGTQILDQIKNEALKLAEVGREDYRICRKWFASHSPDAGLSKECQVDCRLRASQSDQYFFCEHECQRLCNC